MSGESKKSMQCAELDALLSEALEGTLDPQTLDQVEAHARACAACGPLMAEAAAGRRWLRSLAPVEPPPHLLQNILLATSGLDSSRLQAAAGSGQILPVQPTWVDRLREWGGMILNPVVAAARQPRFVMSFGMAFFSLSIFLSLAGVKLNALRRADLRPSAIRRSYFEASGKVVKYYENIRFVYEIESRVREFKRATTPSEPAPEEKDKGRKNNSSQHHPQNQQRNYSPGENQPMLASIPNDPPVVWSIYTSRRFS